MKTKSSYHLYLLRLPGYSEEERNDFIEKMHKLGVSCNVHYKPLPMLTAYRNLGFSIDDYPRAHDYYKNLVSLPLYSNLTKEEQEYVINSVISLVKSK